MKKFFSLAAIAVAIVFVSSDVRARDFALTAAQLDSVTASGGQITSIAPVKTKAITKSYGKRRSAGRGFF